MTNLPKYALITPARNEVSLLGGTLEAMTRQTEKPAKWVIVSDGSTDGTDELVKKYAQEHSWIELIRMPDRSERHFAGKVHAFNAGFARAKSQNPEIIGNLDADVTFEPDHFEFLLKQASFDPHLGVFGAPFREGEFQYDYRYSNIENVWGGCQLFRVECYEAIGGYMPLKGGCIDHVAVVSARMKGWKTRTFTERVCMHHRVMGTAQQGALKARYRMGLKDYSVGNHPLWELFRAVYQMKNRPFVVGGVSLAVGYFGSMLRKREVPLPPDFVAFVRQEQMHRLKRFLGRGRMSVEQPVDAA